MSFNEAPPQRRTCSRCKIIKNLADFHRKGADRFDSACKECDSEVRCARYRRRKSLASAVKKRRAHSKVIDIHSYEVVESLEGSDSSALQNLMKDWIEGVLCRAA